MRILVVLSRVPWPLEKGDKLRAYHLIRELSKKHEIILFCLSDQEVHPDAERKLNEFCTEVLIHRLSRAGLLFRLLTSFFNGLPFQVNYFSSKRAQRVFDRYLEEHIPQHIYCQLVRTAGYAMPYPTLPKTMDYMDALSTGMNRMSKAARWPMSIIMKLEQRRLAAYEALIYDHFDQHSIISEQDGQSMQLPGKVHVIPNGIDERFFEAGDTPKTRDILFTGNMNYRPNVESARYLVNEIMPIVWAKHPGLKVCLAGANPAPAIRALASSKVEVTGWVDDIVEVYRSARIFAAPMLINSGMQNKLLEAMATGLPCITTTLANDAIGSKPGTEIHIGDNAQDFAQHIIALAEREDQRKSYGEAGRAFVTSRYSWATEADRLEKVFMSEELPMNTLA